ncbi:substrate-binding domain-containing protein [Mangrovicoccus ximenensis]|uniref:substrate-binding domain-containing protein n=1 Tax=Mangrovicoccus ximenensis TaxID=1911570 RepID=UPI001F29DA39|nr:substrate-binding domain-containing protein [Mangrovicoccus ximenensis]
MAKRGSQMPAGPQAPNHSQARGGAAVCGPNDTGKPTAAASGLDPAVWRGPGSDYADGAAAARSLLAGRNRPDGVFCITDLVACGFLDAARQEFGLRVPEDLCVLGFDDIPEAAWGAYGLTTFAQPYARIAEEVERMLTGETGTEGVTLLPAPPVWRRTVRLGPSPGTEDRPCPGLPPER